MSTARTLRAAVAVGIVGVLTGCASGTSPATVPSSTVASVSVSGTTPGMGQTAQFSASAKFSNGNAQDVTLLATWSSSNPSIATVSTSGIVTGVSNGEVDVIATYQGVSGKSHITLTASTASTPCLSATFMAPLRGLSAAGETINLGFHSVGPTGCTPTVVSNSSFITVGGVYRDTKPVIYEYYVSLILAPNTTPASRTGTVAINGATASIPQNRGQIDIVLSLLDPARTSGATTECDLRGTTSQPTTCTVGVTVTANSGAPIISYDWFVSYNQPTPGVSGARSFNQTGPNPQITFTDTCVQTIVGPDGAITDLYATLTLTDSGGNKIWVNSGVDNQPSLYVRLFTCGS